MYLFFCVSAFISEGVAVVLFACIALQLHLFCHELHDGTIPHLAIAFSFG